MGCLGQRGGTKWMLGWCTCTCICCCVSQNAFVKEREYTLRVFINNWNNTVGIGYNIQAKLDREVSTEFRGYSRDKHGRLEAHHEQVEHLFLTIEETDLVQDHQQRAQVMRNPWHKLWDNRWPIRDSLWHLWPDSRLCMVHSPAQHQLMADHRPHKAMVGHRPHKAMVLQLLATRAGRSPSRRRWDPIRTEDPLSNNNSIDCELNSELGDRL